jgi:hypothetical protein
MQLCAEERGPLGAVGRDKTLVRLLLQERCDDQVVPVTKPFRSHKAVREIRHQRHAALNSP